MTTYITFPDELIAVPRCPGYVWNIDEQKLYSYKSGVLHELQFTKASHWNNFREGYRISRGGQRRMLTIQYLQTLKPAHTTVEYKHD